MARRQIGDRVGALLKGEGDTVWLLGYGTFLGDKVPDPNLGINLMGVAMENANPCIQLDSGDLVFGCECWWGSEAAIEEKVSHYANVIDADIKEERRRVSAESVPPPATS